MLILNILQRMYRNLPDFDVPDKAKTSSWSGDFSPATLQRYVFQPNKTPTLGKLFRKSKEEKANALMLPRLSSQQIRKSATIRRSAVPAFFFTPVAAHTPLLRKLSSEAVPNKYYDRKFCRSLRIFYRSTCSRRGLHLFFLPLSAHVRPPRFTHPMPRPSCGWG